MPPAAPVTPSTPESEDIKNNKAFAVIGYIFPILFFLPLITDGKNSKYAMFHANQQLLCLILWFAAGILKVVLIGYLICLFTLVLVIIGIVNAANGTMKPLPLVGGFKILNV